MICKETKIIPRSANNFTLKLNVMHKERNSLADCGSYVTFSTCEHKIAHGKKFFA